MPTKTVPSVPSAIERAPSTFSAHTAIEKPGGSFSCVELHDGAAIGQRELRAQPASAALRWPAAAEPAPQVDCASRAAMTEAMNTRCAAND